MPPAFDRQLFDFIESVSREERQGSFSRALADGIARQFGAVLRIAAAGSFKPRGARYEPAYTVVPALAAAGAADGAGAAPAATAETASPWAGTEAVLATRSLQRKLLGQTWFIQRGLRRDTAAGPRWYDLILIPVARDLSRVLGLLTDSLAGEEGAERERQFAVMGQLVRLFVDRHHHQARLQEILTLAREQQLSLLPPALPAVPGYRIAALSLPAEEVGGDYYQVFPLEHELVALALSDAKGKGFEAAMQVTGLHAALRVANSLPLKLLHKIGLVNRAMLQPGEFRNLISLFFAEADAYGRLLYVNCAHPPALWVRPAGQVEELSVGGRFLGLDAEGEYRFGIAELRSGDLLVIYSDGWSEVFNEQGEEFGAERVREVVRPLHGREPGEVIERLQSAADAFRGDSPFTDDRTVLVVRKD
ncbi:MAG TPA: SpoIIE family protein phosphatase [Terriglobales bacterium]|nr:SpoIIE family protein phosphatase [Terriglobales bacterium]